MPKKGVLGCSFPILIIIAVVFIGLLVIGFLAGPIGSNLFPNVQLPGWLHVEQPRPELPAETAFYLFGFPIANTVFTGWITIIVLVGLFWAATRKSRLVPGRLQNFAEAVLSWLFGFCQSVAGEKYGRRFFPLIATIFLMVIGNAWLGLLPGYGTILIHTPEGEVHLLRAANTDINLPLAMALVSFVFVTYHGLRANGFHYVKEFANFGPFFKGVTQLCKGNAKAGLGGMFFGFIAMIVGGLEALGQFIRILSFTFRLFGNMTAGEILILIMMFLVPLVVALPFYGLELLVGYVQALIFGGLTLVFATVAVTPHEAGHS